MRQLSMFWYLLPVVPVSLLFFFPITWTTFPVSGYRSLSLAYILPYSLKKEKRLLRRCPADFHSHNQVYGESHSPRLSLLKLQLPNYCCHFFPVHWSTHLFDTSHLHKLSCFQRLGYGQINVYKCLLSRGIRKSRQCRWIVIVLNSRAQVVLWEPSVSVCVRVGRPLKSAFCRPGYYTFLCALACCS